MNCSVIGVANKKGGVGKTTTAMNLSVALSMKGLRVLAIDGDPHGNLTQGFGFPIQDLAVSVKDLIFDRTVPTERAVLKSQLGFDLIGSNPSLAQTARWMVTQTNAELRLAQRIRELRERYDVIVIDSCPGLGTILNSILDATDHLIIPVDTGFYGYMGVKELLNEMDEIRLGTNPHLSTLGFVLTMTDRTIITRETWDALIAHYGDLIFKTQIRRCVSLRESPATGQSIFQYAPESIGAEDYAALAGEVVQRLEIVSMNSKEVAHA